MFTDCKGWPIIGGLFCGTVFYITCYYTIVEKDNYGTPSYTGPVQTMYLDVRLWAGLVNLDYD